MTQFLLNLTYKRLVSCSTPPRAHFWTDALASSARVGGRADETPLLSGGWMRGGLHRLVGLVEAFVGLFVARISKGLHNR
jgi:hypothetical protein